MQIQLSDHFSYKRLLAFVFPSIVMMVFTSVYGVVDGLFVSNYIGKTAFAAVNFILPFIMILGALGFMTGAGGSAVVSKALGEGKREQANQYFYMIVIFTVFAGVLLALSGALGMEQIVAWLGASDAIYGYCVLYGRLSMISLPCYILQNVFQSMFVAAGKPKLGLYVTLGAGVTNIVLDFFLVGLLGYGIAGAAWATIISEYVGGLVPLWYFVRKNRSLLRFQKASLKKNIIRRTCVNGSSEFLNIAASSLVGMLYNFRLMQYAGENGVAAYGVMLYAECVFSAIFLGYAVGSAPLFSYQVGAGNQSELKNLFCKSITFIGLSGFFLVLAAEALVVPLARLYVGYDRELLEITRHGFFLYAFCFLPMGFNVFGSAFFTALNNGRVSAGISFLRTLILKSAMVLLLPVWFDMDGIWGAVLAAECLALLFTASCLIRYRKKYHYL